MYFFLQCSKRAALKFTVVVYDHIQVRGKCLTLVNEILQSLTSNWDIFRRVTRLGSTVCRCVRSWLVSTRTRSCMRTLDAFW